MELPDLKRMLAYNSWANAQAVASLQKAVPPPERALKVMAHIVGAERLWLGRLRGVPADMPVWPAMEAGRCAEELKRLDADWQAYLSVLDPAALSAGVAYVNSAGEPWKSSVGDILLHVVIHSSYHRGQIAVSLREAGQEPAYTDFIHAVRSGYIK